MWLFCHICLRPAVDAVTTVKTHFIQILKRRTVKNIYASSLFKRYENMEPFLILAEAKHFYYNVID